VKRKLLFLVTLLCIPVCARAQVAAEQTWNIHGQITETPQGNTSFPAKYSGPNSLNSKGEIQETFTADLFAGVRLWRGAELHVDGLMWQGFGLSNGHGIEAAPNGDAFKLGTKTPYFMFAHLFVRQTIGLGGKQESVPDGFFTLAGKRDVSRITITLGRFSPVDMFDNNAYAQDAHTQFSDWAAVTNIAWDFPADGVGYTSGIAIELNRPQWALRYGVFQEPAVANAFTSDDQVLTFPHMGSDGPFFRSLGMAVEFERRYGGIHPGAIHPLVWENEANMISFRAALPLLEANGSGANLSPARAFRRKYGFGLNWEQSVSKDIGLFSRLGWNDGRTEGWMYGDANWTASLGVSIKGASWRRANDTSGLVYATSGASRQAQAFLAAGGTEILGGDGALTYGSEKALEIYYSIPIQKTVHVTVDYEFVGNPAFNRDRGPVSVFGVRFHWQF
jgi:high affinity Mn2+ porin